MHNETTSFLPFAIHSFNNQAELHEFEEQEFMSRVQDIHLIQMAPVLLQH